MRAWCNGQLVDPTAPALAVLDHGITVGDGVFESVKVVQGRPFALTRHLDRLARSARGLGLPEPDRDLVLRAIKETLADEELPSGRIRVTLTAGISPVGSHRGDAEPSLMVTTAAGPQQPSTAQAVTVPWPRNERSAVAGLKTTSYAENVVALAYAAERGASEAIFGNTVGNLCEGTGSNVFCVFDGAVVTPPLSAGCLAGVTRGLLIEWCDVREEDIGMAQLAVADEVFLASTTRDVQAVARLDGRELGGHQATEKFADEWRRREAIDVDP
ncbi:MAG: aminotransferase class IV [Nocardioidaceae bacterium]